MNARDLNFDPVIQLITGKWEKVRVGSTLKEVFVPFKTNKYPSINTMLKDNKDLSREQVLIRERLTQPRLIIDRTVFQKTESERDVLKSRKSIWKKLNKAS